MESCDRPSRRASRIAVLVLAAAGLFGCTTGSQTGAPSPSAGTPATDRLMQFGGYVAAVDASVALADPSRRPTTYPGESAPDFNTRAHTQLLTFADPGVIGNVVVDAYYRLGANGQETSCVVVSRAPGAGAGTRPAWAWVSVGSALSPPRGG